MTCQPNLLPRNRNSNNSQVCIARLPSCASVHKMSREMVNRSETSKAEIDLPAARDQEQRPANRKRKAAANQASFQVENSLQSGVHQRIDPEFRRWIKFFSLEPLFEPRQN